MKKIYEKPLVSVTSFMTEDITTSGLTIGEKQTSLNIYEITSDNL